MGVEWVCRCDDCEVVQEGKGEHGDEEGYCFGEYWWLHCVVSVLDCGKALGTENMLFTGEGEGYLRQTFEE